MPIPRTCECHFIWKQGVCECDQVKDRETGRVSRVIQVGPQGNHKGFIRERGRGGFGTQQEAM